VDWTGGDLIQLSHDADTLKMTAETLLTGRRAIPYLEKYFSSLVTKLRDQCCSGQPEKKQPDSSILDWMPEVAIVMGPMSMALPKADDDDDDF
jgi:hypothetical protein